MLNMKTRNCLFYIILFTFIFTDSISQTNLTTEKAINLSKSYQEKALWFTHAPQYNRDSTLYYFQKASDMLEKQSPLPYSRLVELNSLFVENLKATRTELELIISIAKKTENFYQNLKNPTLQEKIWQYNLMQRWAYMSIKDHKPKEAQAIMARAMPILDGNTNEEAEANYLLGKGDYYLNYVLDLSNMKDLDRAAQFLNRARHLYETKPLANKEFQLYKIYNQLDWYHNLKEKYDSCDYYAAKTAKLMPIINNPSVESYFLILRGNNLFRQNRINEARVNTEKGIKIIEKYGLTQSSIYAFGLNVLGTIEQKAKNFDKALAYYMEGKKQNPLSGQADYLQLLSQLYEDKEDYKKALDYHKVFVDSLASDLTARSEKLLKESELQLNVVKQEKELTQKKTQIYIFGGLIALGVLLLGLLYRNYHLKQQSNKKLELLNEDLANKNTLLDKRNAENELLLKEIHHRVKNNLEVVSSLLALQSAKMDNPDMQEAMLASQNRVQSMGILHQKLYQSEHLAFIEMKNYFQNLCENILDSYNETDRIAVNIDMKEVELDVDTAVPVGLIVNELLTNSLKYAFPDGKKGEIKLSLENVDSNIYSLKISDNGIGKIPNSQAKGTGFGTQLVSLLTRQIDGKLEEKNENGMVISINFKLQKAA
jgi:two-component system, sensor histidine kinase PdtaS